MKCESCHANVSSEFVFAIKNNQCPACGNHLMAPEKLASFINLKELLSSNFPNVDVERMASLIVANFELKQKFKEEIVKEKAVPRQQNDEKGGTIDVDESEVAYHEDVAPTKMSDVKAISERLKQLRHEAFEGAQADHWGLGEANVMADQETMQELVLRQRKEQSHETIISGVGGKNSFTRSG